MYKQHAMRYELFVDNKECEMLNFGREYKTEEEAMDAYNVAAGLNGCRVRLYETSYYFTPCSELFDRRYIEQRKLIKKNHE
jgi:hypothetical protein